MIDGKTKIDFVRLFMTKEQQKEQLKNIRKWLGMDNEKETEFTKQELEAMEKQRPLSTYEKEEIFWVRWFTFILSSGIIGFISFLFQRIDWFLLASIIVFSWFAPPIFYFRKGIYQTLKEKISYWWNMINGRFVK